MFAITRNIGKVVILFLNNTGHFFIFFTKILRSFFKPWYFKNIINQMTFIGYFSLPVVSLTSFFTGGALALQIYYGGNQFNSEAIVSSIVALGITRELGPVLGGIVVAGRVSSAIAAELGTMKVTEQIDALKTLSADPISYLIVPRIISGIIMLPILIIFADIIGIMGGWFIGTQSLGFNGSVYIQNTVDFLEVNDISSGLIKASFFGFIITIMGCYQGFNSNGGAQGVGKATTNAVVSASVLILASNYIMTNLFFVFTILNIIETNILPYTKAVK